jgi:hypothetical protein
MTYLPGGAGTVGYDSPQGTIGFDIDVTVGKALDVTASTRPDCAEPATPMV